VLVYFRRTIASRSKKFIITHYPVLVRLALEYCLQFYSSPFKKDVDEIARFHWRLPIGPGAYSVYAVKKY